jgi:hypothetical protein
VVSDARLEQQVQARNELVKMAVPRGVEVCLAPGKRYTTDVFQGAFPGDVADPRIIKNGDITFALMSNLLHIHGKLSPDENTAAMKQKLIETYAALGHERVNRVCNVWMQSGPQMQRLAQDVMSGKTSLEIAVKSSVYTLTPFDMWILASEYQVPVILFSGTGPAGGLGTSQSHLQFNSKFFCNGCSGGGSQPNARILYSDDDDKADERYHVIVCMQPMNSFPVYGIVQYGAPDNSSAPPVSRYSIEQKDLKFAQPIASLYTKNDTVFDFIDKSVVVAAAPAVAASGPAVAIASASAAAQNPKSQKYSRPEPVSPAGPNILKSLPLIEMKKTGALEVGSDSEPESDTDTESGAEVHDPEIKRLLTHGKKALESSIQRLESPGVDATVQSNAAQAKEKLGHLNI